MKVLRITFLTALLAFALTCTLSANPITFAQAVQVGSGNQFTILNTLGTVQITGGGTDIFFYQVPTSFGPTASIQATLTFSASSIQNGDCASSTCTSGGAF